jgi:hypothetical protein
MTDNGKHRLTEDPELLERFVLETLAKGERAKLEDHLRTCEACRKAVHMERMIAAGARRLGRDEVKERLTRRLSLDRHSTIPWRALAAAAVIITLIGVSITSRWFAVREPLPLSPESEQVHAPAVGEDQRADAYKSEYSAPSTVRKEGAAPGAKGGAAERKIQNAPAAAVPQSENRKEDLAAADKARRLQPAMDEEKSNAAGLSARSPTYWTEGTVLQQSAGEETRLKDALPKPAAAARVERDADALSQLNTMPSISVSQRSAADLPRTRQALQKQNAPNQIQTLVEQRDDGVHLTLYLDSLVDETAIRNSTVRQVGPDSAIVRIANQQIGYRIPSFQQQIPAQKIKK